MLGEPVVPVVASSLSASIASDSSARSIASSMHSRMKFLVLLPGKSDCQERALELYDRYAKQALELMLAKNHDYDEAARFLINDNE